MFASHARLRAGGKFSDGDSLLVFICQKLHLFIVGGAAKVHARKSRDGGLIAICLPTPGLFFREHNNARRRILISHVDGRTSHRDGDIVTVISHKSRLRSRLRVRSIKFIEALSIDLSGNYGF
jgi:hypothetical protein